MKQGWEIKKLKDVTSLITDGDWIESRHQSEDGIRLIQTGNVGNGFFKAKDDKLHFISEETFDVLGCTEIFEGDCLVSRLPDPVGRACLIPEMDCRMITAVDCSIIRFNEILVPDFFVYYSQSSKYQNEISNKTTGTTRKRISRKNLEMIPISVPTLAEQEKIVAELDCLSGIIEKKKQQLKELDNLAQSIFYEMFGDPVENDKGWDIVTLDDVFEIGSSKRVFESQWTDSGVPFYRAREIVKLSKGENIDSPIFISEELYHEYSRKYGVPAEGDMMVTAVGTLGVCYLVKNTDRFYFKDGNTLWFKSRGLCETRFIKDEFATDFIVNQIKGNANAAVVGTYTITNAKKTRVILPPLSLQQEYVRKVQHIDKQKELIAQSIKETETLFNSRMNDYFN